MSKHTYIICSGIKVCSVVDSGCARASQVDEETTAHSLSSMLLLHPYVPQHCHVAVRYPQEARSCYPDALQRVTRKKGSVRVGRACKFANKGKGTCLGDHHTIVASISATLRVIAMHKECMFIYNIYRPWIGSGSTTASPTTGSPVATNVLAQQDVQQYLQLYAQRLTCGTRYTHTNRRTNC